MTDFEKVIAFREEGRSYRDITAELTISETKVNSIVSADNAGFDRVFDYVDMLVKRRGYVGLTEYCRSKEVKDGFLSSYDKLRCERLMGQKNGYSRDDFFDMRANELGLSGGEEYFMRLDDLANDRVADRFLRKHGCSSSKSEQSNERFNNGMENLSYSQNDVLENSSLNDEEMAKIDDFLNDLDDVDSYIVCQRFYNGLTAVKIGSLLGVESQAVYARLYDLSQKAKRGQKKMKMKRSVKAKVPKD